MVKNDVRETLDEFDIPMQGETDLPLSELCGAINTPGQPPERYRRWMVGTGAHLHDPHAPCVLVAIAVERGR